MQSELYERLALDFFNPGHRNHESLPQGLIEEALEVMDAEGNGTRQDLLDELGDVLWYITVMAKQEGSSLDELMRLNYFKLEKRAINGK
jgi:NTP pyrophosphatase (non-canonical NTP hydrolase)